MEKIHFKVEGHLAKLLGRQSILNVIFAVFELCKNGFDADATEVEVFFENLLLGNGRVRIVDNGHGMNLDDIKNKFMMVATTSRTGKTVSPSGRIIVGEKGIGRFAMERLSHRTIVISYPKGESKAYKITINWDRFEVDGISFTEVGNDLEVFDKDDPKRHGIEIISENLREDDEWTKKTITKIDKQLGRLVDPEGFPQQLPFEIKLNAPEFGIKERSVSSGFFDKAPYQLVGKLLPDGKITLVIKYKGKKIVGQGIKDKFCQDGLVGDNPARCGPVTYRMWGFPFDPSGEHRWDKWYGLRFLLNIKDWVSISKGIRIFQDGFRVMPYGEPDNDWTNRDFHARNLSGSLAKRNIVGWVNISQIENPKLIPSSTRFHLIEDDEGPFSDLKNFVVECDKVLDRILNHERETYVLKVQKNIPEKLEAIGKKIRGMKELPSETRMSLSREVTETAKYAKDEKIEKQKETERLLSKLEAYRDLASLGITTGLVAHEISDDLANLIATVEYFEERLKTNDLTKKDLDEIHSNLSSSVRFIRDYMNLVRNFTITLKGDQDEFRRKTVLDVKQELEFYSEKLESLFQRYNIRFHPIIPEDLKVFMYRADFQSIVFNLITNSVKSIVRKRNSFDSIEKARTKHTIKISLAPNPSTTFLQLVFSDDGAGVRPAIRDRIFDIFFSDYKKEHEILKGSGLGLNLVKEITESYAGGVELLPESEFKSGASFLVKLKKELISVK